MLLKPIYELIKFIDNPIEFAITINNNNSLQLVGVTQIQVQYVFSNLHSTDISDSSHIYKVARYGDTHIYSYNYLNFFNPNVTYRSTFFAN